MKNFSEKKDYKTQGLSVVWQKKLSNDNSSVLLKYCFSSF